MDIFKYHNVHKRQCSVCGPYKGENEHLKPEKYRARRRARRYLKRYLWQEAE